ncbi:MAG: stalk domain-containing protein [Bacillota bacterium]
MLTLLPLRFISENLGCAVEWNAQLQEARLTKADIQGNCN